MKMYISTLIVVVILLFSLYTFIIPTVDAAGDEYIFGTDIRVDDDSLNRKQVTPVMAVTSNGRICIAWMDGRTDTMSFDIFFTSSADGGNLFGDGISNTDVIINDDQISASQKQPAIATYINDIYVIWTSSLRVGSLTHHDLGFFGRFRKNYQIYASIG